MPAPIPAPIAAPTAPLVSYNSMTAPVTPASVSRKMELRNILALPARITPMSMPILFIISIPYLKEKTMPSCAARIRCALLCMLKLMPCMEQFISLFCNIRSAPLPKGRMETPAEPIGTESAKSFNAQ
ncbi:hypothetical protein Barb7_03151 [Bacteroidales bacterium Barb7]|nr:hypothetical protein Barb7_03151 [Bacteroidales bacterium Barb7]